MNRVLQFGSFIFLLIGLVAHAQDLVWTGSASNNDFFTEGNWKNPVTNVVPANNTINPGQAINLQLQINTVTTAINAFGTINLGTGSLSIGSANVVSQALSGGSVAFNEGGYIDLSSATPFLNNVQINFTSGIGWLRTTNYSTNDVSSNNLGQIKVNGSAAVYKTNLRLDNYYLNGCVIRSNLSTTTPLTIYDGINLQGASALITVNTLHSGAAIAGSMNNKIESFILKKGFMVTFAAEADGTGKSKNYIASEADLMITTLPVSLQNSISFIRVMPWNWATKKGRTAIGTDLNTTWRYRWSSDESSTLDWEYVPMSWGWTGSRVTDIPNYIEKYNSTHVLSFNEPDDCSAQSGQYVTGYNGLKLCDTDAAVFYYKNLMGTGMRIVSPGCREEGYKGWLKTFYDKATAQDIRIDVIAVHWYDWGGSPASTPNATGTQIFNRFKNYLTSVHNLYPNLPIWITEFNGNPNRTAAANKAFMDLALPYLETLSYVERYNWYPWNPTINFYEADGITLTAAGFAYRDQVSTPSIPGATVNANNNLNLEVTNSSWTGGTSTEWTVATNWSTGIVPNQDSYVTIANGATFQPTISTNATINTLNIEAGATLSVTGANLTVTGAIFNSGTMSLANNSNLIQDGITNTNKGNITVNRNSNALSRLDYTIWSSPVANQNLLAFSPATLATRFYNYDQTSNLYNVVASPSTTAFTSASGYLIRMPDTHPTTPTVWNGSFFGLPNNGTITKAVTYTDATHGYNMVGNPYPSTLDAQTFITANTTKIESNLYFWRKINGASGSAYAVYNPSGGTSTTATPSSAIPSGTIQVGQGFFVKAKSGATTVSFTNAMRLGTTSTQFFKTKQVEKNRVWLNLTNTAGVFSQALIGYITGATLGVDDFDGIYINDSPIALTSNINNEEYTIQGRALPFDPSDVVGLNFKTDVAGDYTIALDHFDGLFANGQDVYLVDRKTGAETDLKATAYTFTAAAGVDNARFSLKYQKTLKVDAPAFNENSVRVYKNNGTLYVNSVVIAISNIKVFDLQGRLIAEQKNVKSNTATFKDLKALHQVLIVEVFDVDKNVVVKKIVN